MRRIWRGPFGLCLRHCLRTVTAPTLLATLVALVATSSAFSGATTGVRSAAAGTPWLTLPLLIAAVGCSLAAAHLWPTFALRRPGSDTVRRLVSNPLLARLLVLAGAIAAQLTLAAPVTIALAWWLDAPAMARRHHLPVGPDQPLLIENGSRLTYRLEPPRRVDEIWLRPRASLPTGPDKTSVEIVSGGASLASTPIAFAESNELVRVPIASRDLARFELVRTGGNVPLLFPAEGVLAVGPPEWPRWQNALLAALLTALPTALALALALVLGLVAGWPTLFAGIACSQFVQWIVGLGPLDEALLDLLRGVFVG